MNSIEDIVYKITDTQDAVRKTEDFLKLHPYDKSVQIILSSLNKRYEKLERDFLECASEKFMDVCTYRIFSESMNQYPILMVGNALSNFQKLFSAVYDAMKHGPKVNSKPGAESITESTLNYGYSFSGSVGLTMTIPSEKMIFDNHLQTSMKKMAELVVSQSSDQVHYFGKELGPAVIRMLNHWVEDHVKSGTGAEIKWYKESEEFSSLFVSYEHLNNLGKAIKETSDTEEIVFNIEGMLVGADIEKHNFHLTYGESEEIKGKMSDSIGFEYTVELPKRYNATIRKRTHVNYAADQENAEYFLLDLKAV